MGLKDIGLNQILVDLNNETLKTHAPCLQLGVGIGQATRQGLMAGST